MKTTTTPKTVSTANDEKALIKVLKSMTVNELLNDIALELRIIKSYSTTINQLDKEIELGNDDGMLEDQANRLEVDLSIAQYLLRRVKETLLNHIYKMQKNEFFKLVDDLDKQRFKKTAKGNLTKKAKIASEHLHIIYTYIDIDYKEAA